MRHLAPDQQWPTAVLAPLLCYLVLAAPRCEAQGNLVPNPSFELLTDTCPCNIGFQGSAKPLYWEKWNQSPDYFHACVDQTCSFDTLIDVPQNGFGFQYPLDGDAYVGVAAYDGNADFREYVGCQLLLPLQVGETYHLSFYTNVAMGGNYWAPTWACSNMGMLFTMWPNVWTDVDQPPFTLRNYAHLHSTPVISDTASWTLVSGTFEADSAYQYLVLGNFFSDALTDTIHLVPGPSLAPYYFVDGVCITALGQECEFSNGIEQPTMVETVVWPNPVSDLLHIRAVGSLEWQVYNILGQVVAQGSFANGLVTIDVGVWACGEYVLRVRGDTMEHVRFVVMR